ncbi:MAG: hypothetical protein KatS3mg031_1898 [Chitinophagales bacterium]|nr:MAG: hypothetical protein KatS3mg031_1898 [Chitinophagales bacterium]
MELQALGKDALKNKALPMLKATTCKSRIDLPLLVSARKRELLQQKKEEKAFDSDSISVGRGRKEEGHNHLAIS